jgi:hypothetical protein
MRLSVVRASLAASRFVLLAGLLSTLAVASVFVYHLASSIRRDTTPVTNGAFLITATLAALSFAWAQALVADDKDRPRVVFAGERFLHASVLLVIASILKYAALALASYQQPDIAQPVLRAAGDLFGVLAAPLFLFAIGNAFAAVLTVYRILWPRTSRYLAESSM